MEGFCVVRGDLAIKQRNIAKEHTDPLWMKMGENMKIIDPIFQIMPCDKEVGEAGYGKVTAKP